MKKWDSRFLSAHDAAMLGSRYPGLTYVPFHELSHRDQEIARRMYPYKGTGAKYPFIDEHYFYPAVNGELYKGGRRVRRVLAIPYKLIMDDAYMASLGYEVNPDWRGASEVLKIAKELVASRPAKADIFASLLAKVRGVANAGVNDFFKVSSNPDQFEVDIFVYADPQVGGRLTNLLKSAVGKAAASVGVRVTGFWTPRADRSVADIGIGGLVDFYRENPYKVTIICQGDE